MPPVWSGWCAWRKHARNPDPVACRAPGSARFSPGSSSPPSATVSSMTSMIRRPACCRTTTDSRHGAGPLTGTTVPSADPSPPARLSTGGWAMGRTVVCSNRRVVEARRTTSIPIASRTSRYSSRPHCSRARDGGASLRHLEWVRRTSKDRARLVRVSECSWRGDRVRPGQVEGKGNAGRLAASPIRQTAPTPHDRRGGRAFSRRGHDPDDTVSRYQRPTCPSGQSVWRIPCQFGPSPCSRCSRR